MKIERKICANPDCKVEFYKEENCPHYTWNRTKFHNRECQLKYFNKKRRGKKRYKSSGAINCKILHDACNRYAKGARERIKEQMIVYDSNNMTQEELWALIPGMER